MSFCRISNSALYHASSVNPDRLPTVLSCPVSRPESDDLFHFSASSAEEHREASKYHQQIQADLP